MTIMAYDLVIKNGRIVDGSGMASYGGDVAISGDRIVAMGRVDGPARRTVDADGLVVAPGFIDHHTHMDAQICWDPIASSACFHGSTSIIMGNCGLTLAPCRPGDGDDRQYDAPERASLVRGPGPADRPAGHLAEHPPPRRGAG